MDGIKGLTDHCLSEALFSPLFHIILMSVFVLSNQAFLTKVLTRFIPCSYCLNSLTMKQIELTSSTAYLLERSASN